MKPRIHPMVFVFSLSFVMKIFSPNPALSAGDEAAASPCVKGTNYTLALHGGSITEQRDMKAQVAFAMNILAQGKERLKTGASSLDTVEWVVRQLEDSGLFNAGRGSNANAGGFVETDASIMDGRDRRLGSVASMRFIKNPVSAARLVMDKSPHVMMVGDRGESYVVSLGAEQIPESYFLKTNKIESGKPHGTVGAVALDRCGNLAAATSTGGFGAKTPGRVGDSPIAGAGVFAQNGAVAISATGHGEYFVRFSVAYDIAARMIHGEKSMKDAADTVIATVLKSHNVEGGVIAVDASGAVVMPYNALGMLRGYVTESLAPKAVAY